MAADSPVHDEEVAACAFMVELLRSGRVLAYIGDILAARVDEKSFPSESNEAVVIRRFCDLVVPVLSTEHPAEALWLSAKLIESARHQIVTDFQLELDRTKRGG